MSGPTVCDVTNPKKVVTWSHKIKSQLKNLNFSNVHEIETTKDRSLKLEMGITLGVESTLLQGFISDPSL